MRHHLLLAACLALSLPIWAEETPVMANPAVTVEPPAPVEFHEPVAPIAPPPARTVTTVPTTPANEEEAYRQTPLGAFDAARAGALGQCTVVRLRRTAIMRGLRIGSTCDWRVKVGERIYPDSDGGICSDTSAGRVNCNIGSQEENAGCLLLRAVAAGYCGAHR